LIGSFATWPISERDFALTQERTELSDGDWGPQGFQLCAGTLDYKKTLKLNESPRGPYYVRLYGERGTACVVRLYGQPVARLGWAPLEAGITHLVHKGDNYLEVEVVTSLRNTFSPLHNDRYKTEDDQFGVGPRAFEDPKHWTDAFWFEPYYLEAVDLLREEI